MGEDDAVLADDGGVAHVSAVTVESFPRKTHCLQLNQIILKETDQCSYNAQHLNRGENEDWLLKIDFIIKMFIH